MQDDAHSVLYAIAADFGGPGIGNTAYRAATGLARAGMLGCVACLSARPTEIDDAIVARFPFAPDGFRRLVGDKLYYEAKNRWFDARLRGLLKEEGDRIRSIHAWNSQATDSLRLARDRGLRVVVERASSHIHTQTRILRDAYARLGIRYEPTGPRVIERCLRDYERADIVTVPSPFAYRSFVENGFPESRLALLPFGADIRPDTPQADPARRDPFTVLFVGQVGVRKGVLDVLAAWDRLRLPDARLVLVGGEEPVARRLFDPWRGRANVVFAGFSDRVSEHMAAAQVFVFPSLEEGSALVTYEAMAHGLPMIVTEQAGSVAGADASALFVPAADPDAVARALKRLYDDPDAASVLGTAARRRVEGFTWDDYGRRVAALHSGMLSDV